MDFLDFVTFDSSQLQVRVLMKTSSNSSTRLLKLSMELLINTLVVQTETLEMLFLLFGFFQKVLKTLKSKLVDIKRNNEQTWL